MAQSPRKCKRALSALLCCLLLAGTPAAAADAPPSAADNTVSALEGLLQNETPPVIPDLPDNWDANSVPRPSSKPGAASPSPKPTASPSPSGKPTASPSPTATPDVLYTVTFQMGRFGSSQSTAPAGGFVTEVPEIPELPGATVLGWFDASGAQVEPDKVPATADAAYTARWSRSVDEFLKTDSHDAYINGYSNGTFKPNRNVSRSEAAQLIYNLMRNHVSLDDAAIFPDVPGDAWYASAVKEMYACGILSGYSDGSFHGDNSITRAEFVKMAVSCDTLTDAASPFTDVPDDAWFAPYVATAHSKGWVSGRPDGTFGPDEPIVRGEAVVILNKMLRREGDADILNKERTKNFYDVFPDNWMTPYIIEASTNHEFWWGEDGHEIWGNFEQDWAAPDDGWVYEDDGTRYYLDGWTRKFLRGAQSVNNTRYLLDETTGAAITGFHDEGTWRRYYLDGVIQDDISEMGLVSGPYFIKVYKPSNYLIIFAREYEGGPYNVPVRAIRTSCGYGTPTGTFYTPYRYRWLQMIGGTWAQWCTQISGSYLFHSVPNWTHDNFNLEIGEYNHLGDTRSAGCIRMNCRDAKWVFENCELGTEVFISSWETGGPIAKPEGLQIPDWHSWDPTDPTAYWKCQEIGCH